MSAAAVTGAQIAADHGRHYVEEAVSVYLMGDPTGADRWVIDPTTVSGEGLYSTLRFGPDRGNCECDDPHGCQARTASLTGVDLPNGAQLVGMLLDALAAYCVPDTSDPDPTPFVEVVRVTDRDGPTEVQVFVGGVPVASREWTVDAGAGWDWATWREHRDRLLSGSSPAALVVLRAALSDPPGGEFVNDRDGQDWLTGR